MKKLFIACGTLQQGGAERIISILSKEFLNYFSEVRILTWREAPIFYSISDQIQIISVPIMSKKKSLLEQMIWFRKFVKYEKPFAVLSFLAPFNILTLVALWGSRVPVFIANRSDPFHDAPNRIWRVVRDIIYRSAVGISVQSLANKLYFSEHLQCKITVIYNPVFIDSDLIGISQKIPKKHTIVSVGRLSRVKNQELLLRVFKRIHVKYPDYQLIIYGEGDYRSKLEKEICNLQLKACVFLPGAYPDVLSKIISAEIFVMTSDYEGMSNALIEAMALGLPVISTKVSGAVDLINDGVNGKLISVGNEEELEIALLDWLENKEKAIQCGEKASAIADKLRLDQIVLEWLKFMRFIKDE